MNALDKEEFRIKLEEINKLVQDKDYKGSHEHCRQHRLETRQKMSAPYVLSVKYMQQTEDMRTVRRFSFLHIIRHLLEKNILYRLIEISLRMDDINEAEEFFEEYKQVASNDSTQYILQYKIARAKNYFY